MNKYSKYALYVLVAFLALISVIGAIAFAMHTPDYAGMIEEQSQAVVQATDKLKSISCTYIGELTQQCYRSRGAECTKLQAAQTQYKSYFETDSSIDCFTHDTSTDPVPQNEQPAPTPNPVFFGDEASGS